MTTDEMCAIYHRLCVEQTTYRVFTDGVGGVFFATIF